jgi:hypothetical protein
MESGVGSCESTLDQLRNKSKRSIQLIGIFPAGFGEISPAAAAPPGDTCDLLHQFSGVQSRGKVWRHGCYPAYPSVQGRCQNDNSTVNLRLQSIDEFP